MSSEPRCCYVLDTKHTPGIPVKSCGSDIREKLILCSSSSSDTCVRPTSRLSTVSGTCELLKDSQVSCLEIDTPENDLYDVLTTNIKPLITTICSNDTVNSHCICNQESFVLPNL